ncbi:DNA/RNA helicase domain-containing protein [Subtercola sp. RTI3]|uniref:DNA/RNA helicase domain-containing protein n=1 Tax=Subtercola sp. RTI3 TaxID=3048639 RepID=UPI002B223A4D|nr:DNA/RNA helicase domain-containing protein [Subtercola sp. RTI3]MEA9984626.1 DUF2075 domain-containing protein [Subtercola sp. RTI3]
MTPFDVTSFDFTRGGVSSWAPLSERNSNWPVVYVLDDATQNAPTAANAAKSNRRPSNVYVGESLNAASRINQHLSSTDKAHLTTVRVIVDETFNKSVCLDLESFLIRMLAGDGAYSVLNRNDGITESAYYDRDRYQETFEQVFDRLKDDGVFTRTIPEIENSDLFKLSPFKALTHDQAIAVEGILEGLFDDLETHATSTTVVQGEPGTGKTVVAIYLMKMLVDIQAAPPAEDFDRDTMFAEFFAGGYPQLLEGLRIGLVVPQQSLRKSIQKVFRKTPGLHTDMVMTAFEAGESDKHFDLLLVDESHRLNQRANQASASQNTKFRTITEKLFGHDDTSKTQLDWIRAKSTHQILFLDAAQSVRPADLPTHVLDDLVTGARQHDRLYPLVSQLRVNAGADYVGYVRQILGASTDRPLAAPRLPQTFKRYDFRLFDSLAEMQQQIRARDAEAGLSRLVAGYAWPWKTKKDKAAFDIEIDGIRLRWNSTQTDWIASPNALEEVGSIHTVQGYDLNYAGVIIGPDLGYDPARGTLVVNRDSYFDTKGKENNPRLGKTYADDNLLRFVSNIYAVLLTRGIMGTYVYVADPALRAYLAQYIPAAA